MKEETEWLRTWRKPKKWYEQAAALGNEDARANMKRVKEKMKKAIK